MHGTRGAPDALSDVHVHVDSRGLIVLFCCHIKSVVLTFLLLTMSLTPTLWQRFLAATLRRRSSEDEGEDEQTICLYEDEVEEDSYVALVEFPQLLQDMVDDGVKEKQTNEFRWEVCQRFWHQLFLQDSIPEEEGLEAAFAAIDAAMTKANDAYDASNYAYFAIRQAMILVLDEIKARVESIVNEKDQSRKKQKKKRELLLKCAERNNEVIAQLKRARKEMNKGRKLFYASLLRIHDDQEKFDELLAHRKASLQDDPTGDITETEASADGAIDEDADNATPDK